MLEEPWWAQSPPALPRPVPHSCTNSGQRTADPPPPPPSDYSCLRGTEKAPRLVPASILPLSQHYLGPLCTQSPAGPLTCTQLHCLHHCSECPQGGNLPLQPLALCRSYHYHCCWHVGRRMEPAVPTLRNTLADITHQSSVTTGPVAPRSPQCSRFLTSRSQRTVRAQYKSRRVRAHSTGDEN